MTRTTAEEVKNLLDNDSLDDTIVNTWIDAANCIVDDNEDCINGSDSKLAKIELYLTAHFIATFNPDYRAITKDKLDVFETSYAEPAKVADGIDNTTFGTVANMLSGGCLKNANDRSISFAALGGDCC